jgi:hypothetical protein
MRRSWGRGEAGIEFSITEEELMQDLDPGWLVWRDDLAEETIRERPADSETMGSSKVA